MDTTTDVDGRHLKDAQVRPTADIERIYRHRFSCEAQRTKNEIWRVIVGRYFKRWLAPEATVLDIGCGYGEFLNHAQCRRRIGVDLNPDARSHLASDVEFHSGDARDLAFLSEASIDVVFTSNLLEHLPTKKDVEHVLKEAERVLKPGGRLIVMGPYLRFLPGEYWDFWDHFTPITDRSLVELLRSFPYEIEECHPKFLPYTTRSALPQAPWLVRLYLRVPLVWKVLGRQFLIIARKPR
jgi:dolichol-phosphate mannosyltransferase